MTKEEAQKIVELVYKGELPLTFVGHFWRRARVRFPGIWVLDAYEVRRRDRHHLVRA